MSPKNPISSRRRAAARRNLEKAWQASRARWEFTPARRAVSLRNLKRAQAALQARGRSPEHLAKSRESIVKARAARTPEGRLRQAEKVLKHGLFALRLRGPLAALGENPRDHQELERLVMAYLGPRNAGEEKLARLVAAALWRHHRLYFAQAAWELERLRKFLAETPRSRDTSAEFTRLRVYALLEILLDQDQAGDCSWRLLSAMESLLRRYLRRRAGRAGFRMGLRLITPQPNHRPTRAERELTELITDPDARAMLPEFW